MFLKIIKPLKFRVFIIIFLLTLFVYAPMYISNNLYSDGNINTYESANYNFTTYIPSYIFKNYCHDDHYGVDLYDRNASFNITNNDLINCTLDIGSDGVIDYYHEGFTKNLFYTVSSSGIPQITCFFNETRIYCYTSDCYDLNTNELVKPTLKITIKMKEDKYYTINTESLFLAGYRRDDNEGNIEPCDYNIKSGNTTKILAPSPNLSSVYPYSNSINLSRTLIPYNLNSKPKSYQLYLYKDDTFNLTLNATNVHDDLHSGKSFYNWLNLTDYDLTYLSLSSPQNIYIGNMSSGQTNFTNFTFTANQLTSTFPTTLLFNLSDFSGNYNDSVKFDVFILNLTIPYLHLENNKIEQGNEVNILTNVSGNATTTEYIKIYHSNNPKPISSGPFTQTNTPIKCLSKTNCQYFLTNSTLKPGFYNITAEAKSEKISLNASVDNPYSTNYDLLVWNTTIYNISITKENFDIDEPQNITFNIHAEPENITYVKIKFYNSSTQYYYDEINTNKNCSQTCFFKFNTSAIEKIGIYNIYITAETKNTRKIKNTELTINVENLTLNNYIITYDSYTPNSTIHIFENITGNVSSIEYVQHNITYYDYFENKLKYTLKNATYGTYTTYYGNMNYYTDFLAPRSGIYNISTFIKSKTTKLIPKLNKSRDYDAFISFAEETITTITPRFRILSNQSFQYEVFINATNGDLINSNITFISSNESLLNLTNISEKTKTIPNLKIGENYTVKWNVSSKNTGNIKTTLIFNTTKYYFHSSNIETSHIIDYIHINPLYDKTEIYNETQKIIAKFSGNFTPVNIITASIKNNLFNTTDTITLTINSTKLDSECFPITASGTKNILYSENVNTTDNLGFNPENSIDQDNSTFWLGQSTSSEKAYLNYTFPEYPVDSINILALSQSGNPINLTIYVKSNNEWILWSKINVTNNTLKTYNTSNTFRFITGISISIDTPNENLLVYESEANKAIINNDNTCYIFTSEYIPKKSGNYTLNATTDSKKFKSFKSTMFVHYGNITINNFEDNTYNYNSNNTYSVTITPQNGDLYNITLTLKSWNESIINITGNNSFHYNLIPYTSTKEVTWNITAINEGSTNITLYKYNPYYNKTTEENATITVITEDLIYPNITNFYLESNITNLQTPLYGYVEAEDDIKVDKIYLELILNNGTKYNFTESTLIQGNITNGLWKVEINKLLTNISNYSVKAYIRDLNSTHWVGINKTETFNTTDKYTLNINKRNIYNRGQYLNITIKDINNKPVNNASCLIILNESLYNHTLTAESNYTEENGSFLGYYSETIHNDTLTNYYFEYQIPPSKNITDYIIYANCSKYGNKGSITHKFNISNQLSLTKIQPYDIIKTNLKYIFSAKLNYKNGDKYITSHLNQTATKITCLDENNTNSEFILIPLTNYPSYENDTVLYNSENCYSPKKQGYFDIKINVEDIFNNSIQQTYTIYAFDENIITGSNNVETITTPGNTKIIYQNGTNETKYIYINGSDLSNMELFTMNLSTPLIDDLKQGFNKTLIIGFSNKGNLTYYVHLNITSNEFLIKYHEKVLLKPYSDKTETITIYAPLHLQPKDYTIKIIASSKDIPKNEKALMIALKQNPLVKTLESIDKEIKLLSKQIKEYKKTGLKTEEIESVINQSLKHIQKAKKAIDSNNITELEKNVLISKELEEKAKRMLLRKRIAKFLMENKWQIIGISSSIGLLLWFLLIYVIPLYNLSRKMQKMHNAITTAQKTKKQTEKQYFKREIDEKTYRDITTKEQEKELRAKSELSKLEKEWHYLVRFQLGKLHKYRRKLIEKEKQKEKQKALLMRKSKQPILSKQKTKEKKHTLLNFLKPKIKKQDKNKEQKNKTSELEKIKNELKTPKHINPSLIRNEPEKLPQIPNTIPEKSKNEDKKIDEIINSVKTETDNYNITDNYETEEERINKNQELTETKTEEEIDEIIKKLKNEFED